MSQGESTISEVVVSKGVEQTENLEPHTTTRGRYQAILFDMDGVITNTASIHAACWKTMFDEYLQKRARQRAESFHAFEVATDYKFYADGKPRYLGVRDFLKSRAISLPEETPEDPPTAETVYGLGNRKDRLVHERLAAESRFIQARSRLSDMSDVSASKPRW
jgi:beta-phosphoglucomutase-like phosphatase (HAD superfamily)